MQVIFRSSMAKSNKSKIVLALLVTAFLSGCSGYQAPVWKKPKDTEVHPVATRQLPLPPTYNPVRWVRPPEVLPGRDSPSQPIPAPVLKQIVSFSVKNASLKETSDVLANAMGYRSYCSSKIADRTVTLEMLGTLDEVAAAIEKIAGIRVVLDHDSKGVRFLAKDTVVPQFAERR